MRHGLLLNRRLTVTLLAALALAAITALASALGGGRARRRRPGHGRLPRRSRADARTGCPGRLRGRGRPRLSRCARPAARAPRRSAASRWRRSSTRPAPTPTASPTSRSSVRPVARCCSAATRRSTPAPSPTARPLVYATAAGTGFLRPSAGPEDLNASDSFEAPQGISVVLRKGARLQVQAKASTLKTRPGKPVQFSASVAGAGSGEQLAYSWYFDDGSSADERQSHPRLRQTRQLRRGPRRHQ